MAGTGPPFALSASPSLELSVDARVDATSKVGAPARADLLPEVGSPLSTVEAIDDPARNLSAIMKDGKVHVPVSAVRRREGLKQLATIDS